MEAKMIDKVDEIGGVATGITVYILTHWIHFDLALIPNPLWQEFTLQCIRLVFTVAAGVVTYLAIHYVKKLLKHEK